jgi:protein quaking
VEDSENRANMKLLRAVDEVKKLLVVSDGEDELKKRQLMELAIINGTYRDSQSKNSNPGLDCTTRFLANNSAALQNMMNQQNAAAAQNAALRNALAGSPLGGAPLILSPRMHHHQQHHVPTSLSGGNGVLNGGGGPPPLISAGDTQGLLYAQYAAAMAASASDYANYSGLVSPLLEYSTDPSGATGSNANPATSNASIVTSGKDRRQQQQHLNGQSVAPRHHPYNRT